MIEGLRVAPAYFDARNGSSRPGVPVGRDCEECRANVDRVTRQHYACAYEPPIERPSGVWSPPAWRDRGDVPTVCPAYSSTLPAVVEVMNAYPQWENGTLTEHLEGEAPTPPALECLAALRGGIRDHESAELRAKAKKGAA